MGTYVTANRVGIELIGISATQLKPKLPHHPKPLPHLEGKAYGYGICFSLCRWATGNNSMEIFSYCADFNTLFCVWCNNSCHIVQYLAGIKEVMFQEILLSRNAKGNTVICIFNANNSQALYEFAYSTVGYIYMFYVILIDCIHSNISIPLRPKIWYFQLPTPYPSFNPTC